MCSRATNSAKCVIHPTAQIADDVKIAAGVSIEAFSIVASGVSIGKNTKIGSHCIIHENTIIGENNILHPFSSLGGASQSRGGSLEEGAYLSIGDNNVIHEYCTINRGSTQSSGVTKIGNHNIIMAYVHIGHDCNIADKVTLVNNTTLAGHVTVNQGAVLGAFTTVRQFSTIGAYSFATESAALAKDLMPYVRVRRSPATIVGVNNIGLVRGNFTENQIAIIEEAYRVIFRRGNVVNDTISWLESNVKQHDCLQPMLELLKASKGIVR